MSTTLLKTILKYIYLSIYLPSWNVITSQSWVITQQCYSVWCQVFTQQCDKTLPNIHKCHAGWCWGICHNRPRQRWGWGDEPEGGSFQGVQESCKGNNLQQSSICFGTYRLAVDKNHQAITSEKRAKRAHVTYSRLHSGWMLCLQWPPRFRPHCHSATRYTNDKSKKEISFYILSNVTEFWHCRIFESLCTKACDEYFDCSFHISKKLALNISKSTYWHHPDAGDDGDRHERGGGEE